MITTNSGIIEEAKYANAPAMLATSEGATWKVVAPMRSHHTPSLIDFPLPIVMPTLGIAAIPLAGKYGSGLFALVDIADLNLVIGLRWRASPRNNCIYAVATSPDNPKRNLFMHRLILDPGANAHTDHVSRNGLDNRRRNLRPASSFQNHGNMGPYHRKRHKTSKFKGVIQRPSGNWVAQIRVHQRSIHLGTFPCEEDAARAYDAAAQRHFGDFAYLNFPLPGERGVK